MRARTRGDVRAFRHTLGTVITSVIKATPAIVRWPPLPRCVRNAADTFAHLTRSQAHAPHCGCCCGAARSQRTEQRPAHTHTHTAMRYVSIGANCSKQIMLTGTHRECACMCGSWVQGGDVQSRTMVNAHILFVSSFGNYSVRLIILLSDFKTSGMLIPLEIQIMK